MAAFIDTVAELALKSLAGIRRHQDAFAHRDQHCAVCVLGGDRQDIVKDLQRNDVQLFSRMDGELDGRLSLHRSRQDQQI